MPRNILYWTCQIVGWGSYSLFLFLMLANFGKGPMNVVEMAIFQGFVGLCILISSHVLRQLIKKNQWTKFPLKKLIPKVLIGTLLASLSAQVVIHIFIYVLVDFSFTTPFSISSFFLYVVNVEILLLLWSLIYFSYHYFKSNRKNELEKLALKASLNEAELMILKNQINPHFLFNALNNIRSLIISDQEKARDMVTHISDLLRYSIQFNASERVTLTQELDIVKDYLALESVQFSNRLRYDFEIDKDTSDTKIPPMAVQLLVENAIKHGISQRKEGGNVLIKSQREKDHIVIQVVNDGQLIERSKREGIGLKNLVDRMKILFGQFAELSVENSSPDTVTASLKIPVI